MRNIVLIVLALCFLGVLAGCCGAPALTIRNPLLLDMEPASVAGPRMLSAPTYYTPQYAPCAPSLPAGYTAPAPCK